MRAHLRTFAVSTLLAVAAARPASAQIADASAVTLGLAGNATATVRGLGALSLNPAGLGMPGSGFSLALFPVQVRMGLHPVTLADLAEWDGVLLPNAVKEEWLLRVDERGSQAGVAGLDVAEMAVTLGRVGVQLSTVAMASMSLSPDVVELVLFGNSGRTGTPTDLALGGSELRTFAVTTASASFGVPLPLDGGAAAFGATFKYSVGHAVAAARELPGAVSSDPLAVDASFPMLATSEDVDGPANGGGLGLDLGLQLERGRFGLGLAVLDVFNTFAWDREKLAFRAGTVFLDADGSTTEFDEQPVAAAPATLVEAVEDMAFRPVLSVGGAFRATQDLTLSADVRTRFGDGIGREPDRRMGLGAEYRAFDALRLRGGVAAVTGATELAAGGSLVLGPVNLSLAGALRSGDQDARLGQFTLSFGGR